MRNEIVECSNGTIFKDTYFNSCVFTSDNGWQKSVVFQSCDVTNCVFNSINPIFKDMEGSILRNNIYPDEYSHKSLLLDRYVNDLPEGDLIGYKKVYYKTTCDGYDGLEPIICKLLIPAKSKRVRGISRKCRTDRAKVLGFYNFNGNKSRRTIAYSSHDKNFEYKVGEFVKPKIKFEQNPLKVCSSGIHFFTKFEEAKNY